MTEIQNSKPDSSDQGQPEAVKDKQALNPIQVISSVMAAGLGVQSSKNRERDFKQGKIGVFIAAGIIFTLVFMGTIYTVVQLVIKGAGD